MTYEEMLKTAKDLGFEWREPPVIRYYQSEVLELICQAYRREGDISVWGTIVRHPYRVSARISIQTHRVNETIIEALEDFSYYHAAIQLAMALESVHPDDFPIKP